MKKFNKKLLFVILLLIIIIIAIVLLIFYRNRKKLTQNANLTNFNHSHTWDSGSVIQQPDCDSTGTKRYTCTECGATMDETLSKLEHNWDSGQVISGNSCTGEIIRKTCSRCGATQEQATSGSGHTPVEYYHQEATCTDAGYRAYKCTKCGSETGTEHYPALGHDYSNYGGVTKEPTCEHDGLEVYNCTRCSSKNYVSINALGHDMGWWYEDKSPTCTDTGEDRRDCSRCSYYETSTISATGHSYGITHN